MLGARGTPLGIFAKKKHMGRIQAKGFSMKPRGQIVVRIPEDAPVAVEARETGTLPPRRAKGGE